MVVDDVEDDADAEPVRRIDEAAQIVRAAVEAGRREQVDAVVAPAELARELGDRHHLDQRDAESFEPAAARSAAAAPGALAA